jgi:hypothetical protein
LSESTLRLCGGRGGSSMKGDCGGSRMGCGMQFNISGAQGNVNGERRVAAGIRD